MWSKLSIFWKCQLMGWTVFAILAFPVNLVLSGTVGAALCSFIVRNGFSFALTLGMRTIYRRVYQNHKDKEPGRIATTVAIVSVAAGLLQLPFHYVLGDLFPFEEKTIFDQSIYLAIFYYRTGLFTCWSLLYFGIRQMREVIEDELRLALIESEKRGAELQMLRAQMNPHFLFNALNAILAAIDKPREQLKALVRTLADYLRYSLETRNEERVQLGQEYDAILSYLAVEKARFREKLEIECIIDPDARKVLVPGIIIQPLVENAIKSLSEKGVRDKVKKFRLSDRKTEKMLHIGLTKGKAAVGHSYPQGFLGDEKRLLRHFADRHAMAIDRTTHAARRPPGASPHAPARCL